MHLCPFRFAVLIAWAMSFFRFRATCESFVNDTSAINVDEFVSASSLIKFPASGDFTVGSIRAMKLYLLIRRIEKSRIDRGSESGTERSGFIIG